MQFLHFQASLTGTSASIYNSLSGQVLIGQVTIQVPEEWTDRACGLELHDSHYVGVRLIYIQMI